MGVTVSGLVTVPDAVVDPSSAWVDSSYFLVFKFRVSDSEHDFN